MTRFVKPLEAPHTPPSAVLNQRYAAAHRNACRRTKWCAHMPQGMSRPLRKFVRRSTTKAKI